MHCVHTSQLLLINFWFNERTPKHLLLISHTRIGHILRFAVMFGRAERLHARCNYHFQVLALCHRGQVLT